MSISNYGELQTSVADWLKRKNLTASIPGLIALGEITLRDGIEAVTPRGDIELLSLRVREMETAKVYAPGDSDTDSATVDDAITTIDLPSNYLEAKYFLHGKYSVERATPQAVRKARESQGIPTLFYRDLDTVYFGKTPTGTDDVTMTYYADFTGALSADSDTNTILTNYPNLYLYAALVAAEPYLFNDKRLPIWESRLKTGLKAAINREKRETRSGGRKRMGVTF